MGHQGRGDKVDVAPGATIAMSKRSGLYVDQRREISAIGPQSKVALHSCSAVAMPRLVSHKSTRVVLEGGLAWLIALGLNEYTSASILEIARPRL